MQKKRTLKAKWVYYSSSNLELEGVLSAFDILMSRNTVSQSNTGIFLETDERKHHAEIKKNSN